MMLQIPSNSRQAYVVLAILLGFSAVLTVPSLIHDQVLVFPYLVKSLLVCCLTFFANAFWLMPRYLFQRRNVAYVGAVLLLVVALLAMMWALSWWPDMRHPSGGERSQLPLQWLLQIVGVLFVSTLYGYFVRERHNRRREIDLTHQNIEFEMKFLKTQINPHFLFNALNNIYALSIIKSERTPGMILMLSDMLRFTLYDSESKKVKLRREIEYITNFIEFQKLKTDSDLNIKMDSSNCNDEFMIEPMLLIPFIENSFKHGNIDNPKKGWLVVDIKTLGPILVFQVRNSLPAIAINKDVVGGIGVENVRKRLDILYPGRYDMRIVTTESEFSVYLKIDTCAS